MACPLVINRHISPLPSDWIGSETESKKSIFTGSVSSSVSCVHSIEPVGEAYFGHVRRIRFNRTFEEDDRIQSELNAPTKKIAEYDENISDTEDPLIYQRDAKDWKSQDHYAVLGLSKLRYKATEDQIKQAYRKKVLRHHPDKKAAFGGGDDDLIFKFIQKATEILLDPVKRRQWDSVDEAADVDPPTKKQLQKVGNTPVFYKLWGDYFQSEARFSKIERVPHFGDEHSTKEQVEKFYNFWYNFDSWRSFEYQDEDVPDDNENRDQKRHVERKNQNARKKKKTEDIARLRKIVDDALASDERIKNFRKQEYAEKHKKRLIKEAEQRKAEKEAATTSHEQQLLIAEKEKLEEKQTLEAKKANEAAKNAAKKNKRIIRSVLSEECKYFSQQPEPTQPEIDKALYEVELIITNLERGQVGTMAEQLKQASGGDRAALHQVFSKQVADLVSSGKLSSGQLTVLS